MRCACIHIKPGQERDASTQTSATAIDIVLVPAGQRLGTMEGVDPSTGRNRVQPTREPSLSVGRLVAERQRTINLERWQFIGIGGAVLAGLDLNVG